MAKEKSIFRTLSEIDISKMVRKKGNFWYLSWSNAVREVSKHYPNFNWEFTSYDGLPFLKTELGYFVECSVTINELTKKQSMPVLDFKNQAHQNPTSADINKSQMRALAKAISLHGLGLDLWAGEDLIGFEDDPMEVHQEKIEKLFSMYNDGKSDLILWGYLEQFRKDDELFQWLYSNFPKGHKTKISEKLRSGRDMFFEYKKIFNSDDDAAKQESEEELTELEMQIINKYL